MFSRPILLAALSALITNVQAQDYTPSCIEGLTPQRTNARSLQLEDGRIFALCYTPGTQTNVIDQNWVNDIDAMLQTMLDSQVCCVDCIPSGQPAGCTGLSTIENADNCGFSAGPPDFDQFEKDTLMSLVRGAAEAGTRVPAFSDSGEALNLPFLSVDAENGSRMSTIGFYGDGDTC